jgi:hypothetical protein
MLPAEKSWTTPKHSAPTRTLDVRNTFQRSLTFGPSFHFKAIQGTLSSLQTLSLSYCTELVDCALGVHTAKNVNQT